MLISSNVGRVETSYVPGLGEEVYDTDTMDSYRGNGYDPISSLTSIVAPTTEVIVHAASMYSAAATVITQAGSDGARISGIECADDAQTDFVFTTAIPPEWDTVAVNLIVFVKFAASANNIRINWDAGFADPINNDSVAAETTQNVVEAIPATDNTFTTVSVEVTNAQNLPYLTFAGSRVPLDAADTYAGLVYLVQAVITEGA
jgi:hypothetical protein